MPEEPDAEWLREQYIEENRTQQDIADECGCRRGRIAYLLEKNGIRKRLFSQLSAADADEIGGVD
jgi:hypothetical protein